MVVNGCAWPEMAVNGCKWLCMSGIAENGQQYQINRSAGQQHSPA
jgi:hypothetical protein